MYKTAFLTFDSNYEAMSDVYRGVERFNAGNGDVQTFVFSGSVQSGRYVPEPGSFAFFSVCDLKEYDGFLILGDNTWQLMMRQALADRILKLDKPVVSVNCRLEGAYRVCSDGQDNEMTGYTAMHVLYEALAGGHPADETVIPESHDHGVSENQKISEDDILKKHMKVLTRFQPAVLKAETIEEIMQEFEYYFPQIDDHNTYLVFNHEYLDDEMSGEITAYGVNSALMACAGQNGYYTPDLRHVYAVYRTGKILPVGIPVSSPVHVVYPLWQNNACIGYVVMEGVSPALRNGVLTVIMTLLSGALESVKKKEMLKRNNTRLDDLYVHDPLTGLFNRFGLKRFGQITYEHLLRDFDAAWFIFVDVDNMKQINDSCGHETGDIALKDTAAVIRKAMENENAFAMRYGGDEFLLISRNDLTGKIQRETAKMMKETQRPFILNLSVGAFRAAADTGLSIEKCIEKADEKMYEIKKVKKEDNGVRK